MPKKNPRFAFEYLSGCCNENVYLIKNTTELSDVELKPYYLSKHVASNLKRELFGHVYDAALGNEGGDHMISLLKTQLHQVMEQVCAQNIDGLKNHLIKNK